ncbi:unnamed protein product [Miscanthus lutarioriparius]|uniref:Uncharacterized protein n=1 Tax=Miscanthus lutarioriparius TaxID=422564 RepID=A0A811R335_9POAL|nr:unnamed protein product [Miscanthus lutarioriparius]
MRSSWADSIAGDEYLPAFNRLVGDINSYEKKLGSGVSYGKSMHAEFVSSTKLKQATSHNNYGDKLSACARSSLCPKKMCVAAKESQYVDTQKCMVPIKQLDSTNQYSKPLNIGQTSSPKESMTQAASHFSVILSPPTAHKEVPVPADGVKEGDSTDQEMKGSNRDIPVAGDDTMVMLWREKMI